VHGVLLLICVLSIPHLLNTIPLASLAAILLITGWRLAKPANFKTMYAQGWLQFLPFVATILCMVFTDLLKGVALGLVFSIFFILRENMRRSFIREEENGVPHLRMAPHVTFLHKASLLKSIAALRDVKHLVIDSTHSQFIDPDVVDALRDYQTTKAPAHGQKLELIGAAFDGPARAAGH
jgi:MFS superfamily sulfate permease-like transporter